MANFLEHEKATVASRFFHKSLTELETSETIMPDDFILYRFKLPYEQSNFETDRKALQVVQQIKSKQRANS